MVCFMSKSLVIRGERMCGIVVMLEHPFFFSPRIWPFSFHCLSQSFHHFKVVLFVDIMGI